MIFVDSSVFIDYFNGIDNWQVEKFDEILGKEILVIGDYILVEVLQGFRNDKDFETARKVLNSFLCLNICGEDIALKSASNFSAVT